MTAVADTHVEPRDAQQRQLRALLADAPQTVRFVQLIRLLERLSPERGRLGEHGDPAREIARLSVRPTIAFPASEVQELTPADAHAPERPPVVALNFMGLIGPLGELPRVYTQLAADRVRARDATLVDFLDMFHHRLASLHYRAWAKYRPLDREPLREPDEDGVVPPPADRVAHHLLDLVGLGTRGLHGRLAVDDDAAGYFAGLLAPVQRSALGLEQLLEEYFEVPVEVVQFVGGWFPIAEPTRTALGDERPGASQLGQGAVAGDEVWDQQSRVRIRLGPLSRAQFERFLPTGDQYRPLETLVRFYTDDRFALDVQLVLEQRDVPPCVLGDPDALPLTWGTWLASAAAPRDRDDTVLPLLSAGSPS
ncbi:MAG: type VI secretion system baseplate subunit TssG [Gemmatimonadaceae bacterium]|nr:type VI secretion system baseplate subunit TssG [Gemmatimonadaceae bacterium]